MTKIIAPPGAPQAQLHQVRWPYFQPQQQATSRPCSYHTDNGLLKALHHVPAYLLEFSSNHWISPSPSTSTQRTSSLTSPRLNFQRAAPKSPVLSPSLKDTYVFYTSKFQLQGPRTPASSLSQSQRAAPSHIGPRSAVINAFRLQNYLNGQSFYLWHCAQGELSQDPEDPQRSAKFRSWMILTALHRRTESGCHSPHFLRIVYKKPPGCAQLRAPKLAKAMS